MSMVISAEPVPLTTDDSGVIRVAGTRVSFDSVIYAFGDGATPEEIVQRYPSLQLAAVYSIIAYYLNHRSEVEDYLRNREAQRDQIKKEIESRFDPNGIRARLLSRRRQMSS